MSNTLPIAVVSALTVLVPILIGITCDLGSLTSVLNLRLPGWVSLLVLVGLYTLMAVSLYTLLSSSESKKHPHFGVAMLLTVLGYIFNYLYLIFAGCGNSAVLAHYAFLAHMFVLPAQIFLTYGVNQTAALLLTPLLSWAFLASGKLSSGTRTTTTVSVQAP